jgi:hypothetical protein
MQLWQRRLQPIIQSPLWQRVDQQQTNLSATRGSKKLYYIYLITLPLDLQKPNGRMEIFSEFGNLAE